MSATDSGQIAPLMNTYARLPVFLERGQGAWVWDESGKKYLDALAGIAVSTLGHAHPALVQAIRTQAEKLIHCSNVYGIRAQEQLAGLINRHAGMEATLFCNSGAEANEAALKLARLYGHQQNKALIKTVVMERAWHGRTIATLAATGSAKAQHGFEPLPHESFVRVPFNDIAAVENAVQQHPEINSVLLEVVQGEGGVQSVSADYLQKLRALCDQHGWLLMLDEVQCGIGRTGKWFGFQHFGVTPDVITLAKGLAGGVPIGAIAARGKAAQIFTPGTHGTTFGGNPLACAAGIATLETLERDNWLSHAAQLGNELRHRLEQALADTPGVVEVRGLGLMLGIELDRPCGALVTHALQAGLLINVTRDNVIRLLPPLVLSASDADFLLETLVPLIQNFLAEKT